MGIWWEDRSVAGCLLAVWSRFFVPEVRLFSRKLKLKEDFRQSSIQEDIDSLKIFSNDYAAKNQQSRNERRCRSL